MALVTTLVYSLLTFCCLVRAIDDPFSQPVPFSIRRVFDKAVELPSHSWEYGTAVEAQLELLNPELSVFANNPFPVPTVDKARVRALTYADEKIVIANGTLSDGDGAVGDPASLGVAALLLSKTIPKYVKATTDQLNHVVNQAPRAPNGAISHREDVVELWADFMYMAPPFMAYYAADHGNASLLKDAVHQATAYREVLGFPNATNNGSHLWQHIVGPTHYDPGHWSTSMGWAAAGMTRVLAVVKKAPCAERTSWRNNAEFELASYIKELADSVMRSKPDQGLVRNYVDVYNDPTKGYGEFSGTLMMANAIYRMIVMEPRLFGASRYEMWASNALTLLGGHDKNGTYVTEEGIVRPTVNPLNWGDPFPFQTGSPEGQSMATLAYAAYRDCVQLGKCQPLDDHN